MTPESFNIVNIRVHACTSTQVINFLMDPESTKIPGYVTLTGVHSVIESWRDQKTREAFLGAKLNVPDGMPLVFIGKLLGKKIGRVYGPDLMMNILENSDERTSHFFLGGKDGVAHQLKLKIEEMNPRINIVKIICPKFGEYEEEYIDYLANEINQSSPDLIWVGIGTPRQDLLMKRLLPKIKKGIMLGVGAAFDFNTGLKTQCPTWLGNMGFEWLYRLVTEPKRLWKRYFTIVPLFLILFPFYFLVNKVKGVEEL